MTLENAHDDVVIQAAFNTKGDRFVTASYDRTARVWDTASRETISVFRGHEHELINANFSPDGRRVASTSSRGTVRVWETETGKELFSQTASDRFFEAIKPRGGLRVVLLNF